MEVNLISNSSELIKTYTVQEEDKIKHSKLTPFQASLNLGKCVVGAGCFILPKAFQQAGIWAGLFSVIILGLLSTYTIKLLAMAERRYVETRLSKDESNEIEIPSYYTIGRDTFGPWVGGVIGFGMVATIIGVCGVYIDFISSSISEVSNGKITQKDVVFIVAIPLILLSWLRSLKYLVHTSLLGDIAVTGGIIAVLVYGIVQNGHRVKSPFSMDFFHFSTYPEFFGQCVFLFAIHAVILPIAQGMAEPRKFANVANWSFTFIVVVNGIFGFFGYMLYGEATEGLILKNVEGPVGDVVKIMLCVDLFFTIPIVLCAPRELVEKLVLTYWGTKQRFWKENFIRAVLVVVFIGLSLLVPDINDLASLVGSLVSPTMGFIIPPLLHLHFHKDTVSNKSKIFHFGIVLFGAFSCVFTTYVQIKSMV